MDILEQADASMCRENVGCKPDVCVCGVMGDMKDEIERLREALQAVIRYAGNSGDDYLADKARKALEGK